MSRRRIEVRTPFEGISCQIKDSIGTFISRDHARCCDWPVRPQRLTIAPRGTESERSTRSFFKLGLCRKLHPSPAGITDRDAPADAKNRSLRRCAGVNRGWRDRFFLFSLVNSIFLKVPHRNLDHLHIKRIDLNGNRGLALGGALIRADDPQTRWDESKLGIGFCT